MKSTNLRHSPRNPTPTTRSRSATSPDEVLHYGGGLGGSCGG